MIPLNDPTYDPMQGSHAMFPHKSHTQDILLYKHMLLSQMFTCAVIPTVTVVATRCVDTLWHKMAAVCLIGALVHINLTKLTSVASPATVAGGDTVHIHTNAIVRTKHRTAAV